MIVAAFLVRIDTNILKMRRDEIYIKIHFCLLRNSPRTAELNKLLYSNYAFAFHVFSMKKC